MASDGIENDHALPEELRSAARRRTSHSARPNYSRIAPRFPRYA